MSHRCPGSDLESGEVDVEGASACATSLSSSGLSMSNGNEGGDGNPTVTVPSGGIVGGGGASVGCGDGDGDDDGALEDDLHSVPLVHLSLRNITYAPVTRSYGSGRTGDKDNSGNGGCLDGFLNACKNGRRRSKVRVARKTILNDVSADLEPGQLRAWMGPSGSGKTSLTRVAANLLKDPKSDLVGESRILVNGEVGMAPKRLVGVVWQDDLLLSNLTVRETIAFAARLKTPAKVPRERVEDLVDKVIDELGLSAVRDSPIGNSRGGTGGRAVGISGGERKRVAVAVELVARPSVLLLDEPTSGLDASSALALMKVLKDLATRGHSVAAVVHQPRTTIFDMFDSLLLLSKGRVVFSGHPCDVRACLESAPGVSPLPPQTGIADWIMDTITEDERGGGGGGRRTLPDHWRTAGKDRAVEEESRRRSASESLNGAVTTVARVRGRRSSLAELHSGEKFMVGFATQLRLLIRRCMKQQRGEKLTRVSLLTSLTYTFFTALFWWRLPDTTDRIYERSSLLFFFIIAQSNRIVTESVAIFQRERALFQRERAKNLYGVLPYFLAFTVSDLTNSVVLPCGYGAVVYWTVNLRPTAAAFFTYMLTLYLTVSTAQSMGLFFSIAIPNLRISLMLAPLITLLLMILGGFYIPLANMNPAVSWASWLSMARYGYSAFIVNEFGGRYVPCAEDAAGGVPEEFGACPVSGDAVVRELGIAGAVSNVWVNVGILVAMQLLLRLFAYLLLRRSR